MRSELTFEKIGVYRIEIGVKADAISELTDVNRGVVVKIRHQMDTHVWGVGMKRQVGIDGMKLNKA